jgi:hypothetical protein
VSEETPVRTDPVPLGEVLEDTIPVNNSAGNTMALEEADKLRFFSDHVRGVLTLASAAIPAIVGVFGLLFRKDAAGNVVLPAFAASWLLLPAFAVLSFLISILAGVVYSYYLCKKTNQISTRIPQLDWASFVMHFFFGSGVVLFSGWAFLMIFHQR